MAASSLPRFQLAPNRAKEDYFKQQSDFVNRNRNLDKLAEFSTNIEGRLYQQSPIILHFFVSVMFYNIGSILYTI